MTSLLWLRRDLRRTDLPALNAAAANGPVAVVFVLDPAMWAAGGPVRRAWLAASVQAAREAYEGALAVRVGDPRVVMPALARRLGAHAVHVSRETTPAGRRRDAAVAAELARSGIGWVETGGPYAVGPGRVVTGQGEPYKVFTPFARAWREHGWPAPAAAVSPEWVPAASMLAESMLAESMLAESMVAEALAAPGLPTLPPAGEQAALARFAGFLDGGLAAYDTDRDRADLDGTSFMSPYLKVGAVHPRTLLAAAGKAAAGKAAVGTTGSGGSTEGVRRFVDELAWREFYADVLWHHPGSAWRDLRDGLSGLAYDADPQLLAAWQLGRTGYPFVDAGMRQLLAIGWMHNRVRMVTASFLTKDLHAWWPMGARWFLDHLLDGDVASNSHGWQWVAGTGTDAAPYFRVFNPVTQGLRFDPDGAYVRRWVPELAHLPGASAHEPWKRPDGYAAGYPQRVVDHAVERVETLARYDQARGR